MIFDGAFHVPSWCRPSANLPALAIGPEHLIRHCQQEEGVQNDPNAGAMALATWLLDDPDRAAREAKRHGSPLSMGGVINRLLAGVILPSAELAESLAGMTGGTVAPALFGKPAVGAAMDAAQIPDDPEPAALPAARNVLGETPPGPLFQITKADGFVEVYGLGITIRPSLAAAAMLRDGLSAALAR